MIEEFTPMQRVVMRILDDGMPHSKDELMNALGLDMKHIERLRRVITTLRPALIKIGQTIVCENIRRRNHYRRVRLLNHKS